MKATFGEYIKKLRTDNGLTLTQLAFQLDLDSANLSKIENGKREFDETLGDNYFVYYLVINDEGKNIFVIQNPIKQFELGNIKVDKNLVVEFSKTSGQWHRLLEIAN